MNAGATPPRRAGMDMGRAGRRKTLAAIALSVGAAACMPAAPAAAAVVGPPSFSVANNLDAATNTARAVAVADFNADGKPDVATASQAEGLGVHLATAGGYGPVARYSAPPPKFSGAKAIHSLVSGDFNGDGKPDLAAQDARGDSVDIVWINHGDGTFADGAAVALNALPGCGSSSSNPCQAAFPVEVVTGDFNGDGKLDLVTAATNTNNNATVLGNGDGTFGAPSYSVWGTTSYGSTMRPIAIASADINGDGKLDLAAVDSSSYPISDVSIAGTDVVKVMLGNGDGTFAAPTEVRTGVPVQSDIALGDVNEDGKPDLVALKTGVNANAGVQLGDGTGGFGPRLDLAVPGGASVTLGDVNADGHADVVVPVGTLAPGTANDNRVVVIAGDGTGAFAAPVSFGLDGATGPQQAAVADLTGDGLDDIVTANINSLGKDVSVLTNTTTVTDAIGEQLSARIPAYVSIEGGSASFGDVTPKFTATQYLANASLKIATTSPSGVRVSVAPGDPGNTNLGGLGDVGVLADVNLADNDDLSAWFGLTGPVSFYLSNGPVNTTKSLVYRLQVPAGKVLRRGDTYSEPITYTATSAIP